MKVVVTGIGLISALGNLDASWRGLIACQSGIQIHQPFLELSPLPLALIGEQLADPTSLTQLVVAAALQDAGLVPPLPDCGVAMGSSRSHQASWEKLAVAHIMRTKSVGADLENWLEMLPHTIAIATARSIGATGAVLAPMAACATGIWAIAQAKNLIEIGQCQQAIAGAVEAPITPLTLTGFGQMGALAKAGAYPFDCNRQGFVLGEGAAVLVLESAELADRRGAKIYGQILGFGLTSDAYRANTPEPGGKSAIAAIKQCLERSNLSPSEIDYIHAHGTATQINDRTEAQVIEELFPQGVPVSSTKGATGHTLGASGALGVAFCLMALRHQILPSCVGLNKSQFDLDLVTASRRGEIQNVLCLSFGFGGQNGAIALKANLKR